MKNDMQTPNRKHRRIVVRLYGEECRRYHTDMVVEVPATVAEPGRWIRVGVSSVRVAVGGNV